MVDGFLVLPPYLAWERGQKNDMSHGIMFPGSNL